MGLFDKLFGNAPEPQGKYEGIFKLLDGYTPRFTSWSGGLYESELIRSAINTRATHIGKLKVETFGSAKRSLQIKLQHGPNEFQTWSQFLYRLSTILDVHNTAFILPVFDDFGEISGIYGAIPTNVEIVQYNDIPFLRYRFHWGEWGAVELDSCGIMTKFQYRHDLFGENNHALFPTMELIHIQNQGIEEGVKSSATYRFIAQMGNFIKDEDLVKERTRFSRKNFSREAESGGVLLFPHNWTNIKQITSSPFVVDDKQMQLIKNNVFEYFGVNEDVLMSKAYGDMWTAFYESAIEPFAIQFSEVLTRMLFTFREQSSGNYVMTTANRLQYMSNADKLAVSSQMLDRGLMSINEVRDIWNLSPVEGGDVRIIRGEYYSTDEKIEEVDDNANEE